MFKHLSSSNSRQESSYISNYILKIVHLLFNAHMQQALDYVGLDHEAAWFTKKTYTYEGTE